jgi:subtilase family serine protease
LLIDFVAEKFEVPQPLIHYLSDLKALMETMKQVIMNKNNFSLASIAAGMCMLACLLGPAFMHGQQSLQVLRDHVVPAVASGKAAPVGLMQPTEHLDLAITLPLRNEDELMDLMQRQHDPASPDFRRFLSVEEFTEQFGPASEDYEAVVAFAKANGFTVTNTSKNRMVVDVNGSVDQIQKTFHVTMGVFQHPTEDRTFYSPDRDPSLDLSVPVSRIVGLNNFSIARPRLQRAPAEYQLGHERTGSGPGGQYLGSDMRAAYYGNGPLTGAGQSVGLFEYDGYDVSDIKGTFGKEKYTVPIKNVLVNGGQPGSDGDDGEQVLDIVQAISMAPGLKQVLVYIGPCCSNPTAVDILNRMATDNVAKQLSCSWGWNPDEKAIHLIFAEMGVQGQTFLTASGDNGAIGPDTGGALVWPADDAFQTAVGATDLTTTGAGGAWKSETAWQFSAGGPSDNGISIPWYQVGLANSSNKGSKTLRNLPDVAAEGNFDNYLCDQGSCGGGWGGTSFAAPRWAGFMALVNQQAAMVGYPPIGFINPDVYAIGEGSSYGQDFHDITKGNNNCCGESKFWNAVTGYDLVTGWGTPNGPDLIYGLVRVAPPAIESANHATFEAGVSRSFELKSTGLPAEITYTATGLPSGVKLSSSGHLSGIVASSGTFTVTITANNGVAPNATQKFTLTVVKAPSKCNVDTSSSLFTDGQGMTFTAKVGPVAPATGTVTGTVQFVDSANSLKVLGTKPVVNGVATLTTALKLPPAVQYVKAVYSGNGSFLACQSESIAESLK